MAKARSSRLLVVDDHHDTCIGMKMMLERRGYEITARAYGRSSVKKRAEENFDLIISDIGLPDRSGYELMQELRATKGLRGIALSGFGMENDITRARDAGFSEHLTKPINFERLEGAIQKILEPEAAPRPRSAERQLRLPATGPLLRPSAAFALLRGFLQFARKFFHALAHDLCRP